MDPGGKDSDPIRWSKAAAHELLLDVDTRLAHVMAVARRAEEVAAVLPVRDRLPLVAAAYLQDVGYVCNLVAHHSGARFEAEERGLLAELEGFDLEAGPVMDALVFADLTTGPDGGYVSFEERLGDILARYSPDDPVHRAIARARRSLAESVERTERRLAEAGHPMYGVGRASR